MADVYTIDPLNERCKACDRRIGIFDDFCPALYQQGIVHARCIDDQVEPRGGRVSDQLDLLSMVRPTDPETSRAAALLTDRKGGMRRVMAFLTSRPGEAFTDHEIAEATGMDKGSASKRRLDCQRQGLIEFAGTYGTTPTGAAARKWRATSSQAVA